MRTFPIPSCLSLALLSGANALFLAGCSTSVTVSPLEANLAPGTEVKGIPFRSKERYEVQLYRLVGGEYVPVVTNDTVATLANQERLYVLKMSGSALSDGTVKVKINGDNTLSFVSVDSVSRGQEVLTELGKGAKSVADAQAARNKTRADAEKGVETSLVGAEDARLAALDAQREAVIAQIELEALPAGTTHLDRTKAEQKVSRARLIANQKARRGDLPLPFPDTGT